MVIESLVFWKNLSVIETIGGGRVRVETIGRGRFYFGETIGVGRFYFAETIRVGRFYFAETIGVGRYCNFLKTLKKSAKTS